MLANARMERFAVLVAQGKTATEAYGLAGYSKNNSNKGGNACALLRQNKSVVARVAELSGEYARKSEVTREWLVEKGKRFLQLAEQNEDASGGMQALKEIGVLTGHRVERREIGGPGDFAAIEAMSRAELIVFIEQTLASGELKLEAITDESE